MFGRTRFQQGSLQREQRRHGPAVWIFRWYESRADGKRQRQYRVIGSVEQYPTAAAAQAAAAALRLDINLENRRTAARPITVGDLINYYEEKELALESTEFEEHEKTYNTKQIYRGFLERWIRPRWEDLKISDVRTVVVEEWLRRLTLQNGRHMAPGTKAKISQHHACSVQSRDPLRVAAAKCKPDHSGTAKRQAASNSGRARGWRVSGFDRGVNPSRSGAGCAGLHYRPAPWRAGWTAVG